MKHFTSTDAKTRFGEFIEAGMHEGVCLTRNGRPAGYLVPAAVYEAGIETRHNAILEPAGNGVEETLIQYSLGQLSRLAAMKKLNSSDYGQLLRLLNATGLPHPTINDATRSAMSREFDAALKEAS